MKNFILIHLESVSELIFRMNSELFPNLNRIIRECTYYKNYYSTATSTLMVMSDLCYGGMYREKCTKLEDEFYDEDENNSLFDELTEEGYRCKGIIWPRLTVYSKLINAHVLGKSMDFETAKDYETFIQSVGKSIGEEGAFALFILNSVSHVSYRNAKEIKGSNSFVRWEEGYKLVDDTCGKIFEFLEAYGKKEETIVILYGDHGDDYWGHRLHNGYTHAIEPYTSIIHTPLIVWDGTGQSRVSNGLTSTLDIKDKALNMLLGKASETNRTYIFSRNIYANQKNEVMTLGKGYAVASEEYILLVSIKGLELYNSLMDPTNTCNLLDFFDIDSKGNINFCSNLKKLRTTHFRDFFSDGEKRHLREVYRKLREYLLYETEKLYKTAGKSIDDRNAELNFKKVHRIHYFNMYHYTIVGRINKYFGNRRRRWPKEVLDR